MSGYPMRVWRVGRTLAGAPPARPVAAEAAGLAPGDLVALILEPAPEAGRAFVVLPDGMGEWHWTREISRADYDAAALA